jgi:hypothetical protein
VTRDFLFNLFHNFKYFVTKTLTSVIVEPLNPESVNGYQNSNKETKMKVGVLKEIKTKENRVAMTPSGVEQMMLVMVQPSLMKNI